MKMNKLGKTGLEVTELCFGALPFGPMQKNLNMVSCTRIVERALESGINFVDTAQSYLTYEPIERAMKSTGIRPVIATKSAACDYEFMKKAVSEALAQLDVDVIDIFHLHAARADDSVFSERQGALECLLDCKAKGLIKAVGISTHSVKTVQAVASRDDIDVVFPIINISGIGILHGTREEMLKAIADCIAMGKGVYVMKALGGGTLIDRYDEAMTFAREIPGIASIALGMVSEEELKFNLDYFEGRKRELEVPLKKAAKKRFFVVPTLCNNCGQCRETCPNEAIAECDGRSQIETAKCLTCGYCVGACKMFAIRMI